MHNGPEAPHFTERLREIWSRRKWLAASVFALAAAAGVTLALSLPDVYRATATVLVEEPRTEPAVAAELDRRLQLISQEILSRARLAGIIRDFDLYRGLRAGASQEAAVAQMRRDIRTQFKASALAGGAGGAVTLAISYRGTDAATVTRVANALAALYLEEDRNISERQASGNVRMLGAQLRELEGTVQAQERELAAFQDRHMGELPQQSDANLAALEQLHADLRATTEERMRALDRRNELLRRLAETEGGEAAPPATAAPPGRLDRMREELADLRRRFSDRYPDVVRLKAEIAQLEEEPAAVEASAPVPAPPAGARARTAARTKDALAEVERDIEAFRSDEARLRAGIAGYIQRLENAPRRQRAFLEISRDYQTTRDLYDALRKRYEQAQLEEGAETGRPGPRFRVLDEAVAPAGPAAPNRLFLLLAALVAALAGAGAAAALAERLDTTFRTTDDVRAFTGVPVLVTIPRLTTAADVRLRRRRFWAAAASVALAIGVVVQALHQVARDNEALVALLARSSS